MKGWKEIELGEIGKDVRRSYKPNKEHDLPYVGYEHIEQQTLRLSDYGSSRDIQSDKKYFRKGEIIFGTLRPYFRKVIIANFDGVCSTDLAIVNANDGYDQKFLFYILASQPLIDFADVSSNGTKMPRAKWSVLAKTKWNVPPLPTQHRIASILSAYDDLIEVNNQRIKLLEQTARELYKEWFVRMRFPGYKKTKFKKGIPEGWEVKPILSLCSRITDGTHDTPKPVAEGIHLITGTHLLEGKIDFDSAYKISLSDHEKIKRRSGLEKGDILFSNIGTIGLTAIVTEDFEYSVKNVIIFKPLKNEFSLFLNYMIKSVGVREQMLLDALGTSQQFISLGYIRKVKTLIPNSELIEKYSEIVKPMFQQQTILNQQNTQLRQIRDRLLPRLVSGKLQVKGV